MKEFGKQAYADTIYVNFDSNSRMAELFASDLDTDRLIMGLELYAGRKINPDNSLLIFDEKSTGSFREHCHLSNISMKMHRNQRTLFGRIFARYCFASRYILSGRQSKIS